MKVGDLVEWILKNRRGRAFKDWTTIQIIVEIDKAINTNSLFYETDSHGHFVGVLLIYKDEETKTAESGPMLTTKAGIAGKLVKHYCESYPSWTSLIHDRRGGIRQYDSNIFLKKLSNKK